MFWIYVIKMTTFRYTVYHMGMMSPRPKNLYPVSDSPRMFDMTLFDIR